MAKDQSIKKNIPAIEYITHANLLKERKWTEKLVKMYLKEPCKLVSNPHYKSSSPMRLYALMKVKEAESQESFKEYICKKSNSRKKISEATLERVRVSRTKLIETVNSIRVDIPISQKEVLIKNACDHYNDLWGNRERCDKHANPSSDIIFLNRIMVNYLRHSETQYEEELYLIFGKVGVKEAYCVLKNNILTKISLSYPFLMEECEKQKKIALS